MYFSIPRAIVCIEGYWSRRRLGTFLYQVERQSVQNSGVEHTTEYFSVHGALYMCACVMYCVYVCLLDLVLVGSRLQKKLTTLSSIVCQV